jgi:hypothetical protein
MDFASHMCRVYLSEIFFLFASLIAAWFLCWRWTRIYFLLGSLLPAPIFFGPDFISPLLRFFLLCIQESRPLGLPLGSPSGCVGLGQGCLFFFPSLQAGARRAGTASDLFTRCCCFHLPTAFSLILCLLISR